MDNFQYSIQLSDQDWAEFSATAEECGLLQAGLASGDELLSSDIDQGDSSGSSPPGPPPLLTGQLAPRGRGWRGRAQEDDVAAWGLVSRSPCEPVLALGAGQQAAGTSAQSEALLSPCSASRDEMQRLLQGPTPSTPGEPPRSPESAGRSATPQKPPDSPGPPPRSPSRKKRRAVGAKKGGRLGAPGPATQPGSPLLTEAPPEEGLSLAGPARLAAEFGQDKPGPDSTGAPELGPGPPEQVARGGPGLDLSTPGPVTEQGADQIRMTPRAEPHMLSVSAQDAPPDVSMAKPDVAMSTPASKPPPNMALSTPASEPLPNMSLSTSASEPDMALSTPAFKPQPDMALSMPASKFQSDIGLSTPASEPQPNMASSTPAFKPQPNMDLSASASKPQSAMGLSTPASKPQSAMGLSTPASKPQSAMGLSTSASKPDLALPAPASKPQPDLTLSTPAFKLQPDMGLSIPASKPRPNMDLSTPASKPQPDMALSTPAFKPQPDMALSMPASKFQSDVGLSTPASEPDMALPAPAPTPPHSRAGSALASTPRLCTGLPTAGTGARAKVETCAPVSGAEPGKVPLPHVSESNAGAAIPACRDEAAKLSRPPAPQAESGMVETEVVVPSVGHQKKPGGEPSARAPGHPSGEASLGPVPAPKRKKVRFSMAMPSPEEPGPGEAQGPISPATAWPSAPRTATGARGGSAAWDAVAIGPRSPQPRILKRLPPPAPSASVGPGPGSCFAVTLPEAYEFFFCDTIKEEDEDAEDEAAADQLGEVQWPDTCEFFFRDYQAQRSRHRGGCSPAPPPKAEPGPAAPLGDPVPISIPEAYEHFFGEDRLEGVLPPDALLQLRTSEPLPEAGPGTPTAPGPATVEQLSLALRQAGELRSPFSSSSLSQKDMCLVFVAFATWAVRTSDLHAPDAWKTVLLANIGTISAIRYFRRRVGRGRSPRRSRSPSPSPSS